MTKYKMIVSLLKTKKKDIDSPGTESFTIGKYNGTFLTMPVQLINNIIHQDTLSF